MYNVEFAIAQTNLEQKFYKHSTINEIPTPKILCLKLPSAIATVYHVWLCSQCLDIDVQILLKVRIMTCLKLPWDYLCSTFKVGIIKTKFDPLCLCLALLPFNCHKNVTRQRIAMPNICIRVHTWYSSIPINLSIKFIDIL